MQFQNHESPNACGCGHGHGRGRGQGHRGAGQGSCCGQGDGCDSSIADLTEAPLTDEAHAALLEGLDDEYRARAFYLAVLDRFPNALPFDHIEGAEERHANALSAILRAYGRAVPTNPYIGGEEIRRSVPASLACACDMAVKEERHNDELYECLLRKVDGFPLIRQVFTRLMLASRERHLPAFEGWGDAYRKG